MNFLAHLYLSGDNVDIRMGNFIGDYVKGRSLERYQDGVQKGIFIHRAIDFYTDNHPATFEVRQLFREGYRKYAGVVVDVFFDHFLARYWATFSPFPLKGFTRKFYYQMILRYRELPSKVRVVLPLLIQTNRLYSYHKIEGMEQTLQIMSRVTSLPDRTEFAIETLLYNYSFIRDQFLIFFPDIIDYIKEEYNIVPSGWNGGLIKPGTIELKENKEEDSE
ncbi:MAG: ACP phosphodiesterase [Bacteroidales bacterium]|nr:ACP phosphodiesterase [Bacteroidales bacterium]MDD4384425.1 ACP phosphodiesterase [Bacteroidales bacterium]MDY0196602.1 ACP phosphodiesterase [Tenuifilaceae bacterium]